MSSEFFQMDAAMTYDVDDGYSYATMQDQTMAVAMRVHGVLFVSLWVVRNYSLFGNAARKEAVCRLGHAIVIGSRAILQAHA
jgi:hypothetical protein